MRIEIIIKETKQLQILTKVNYFEYLNLIDKDMGPNFIGIKSSEYIEEDIEEEQIPEYAGRVELYFDDEDIYCYEKDNIKDYIKEVKNKLEGVNIEVISIKCLLLSSVGLLKKLV